MDGTGSAKDVEQPLISPPQGDASLTDTARLGEFSGIETAADGFSFQQCGVTSLNFII